MGKNSSKLSGEVVPLKTRFAMNPDVIKVPDHVYKSMLTLALAGYSIDVAQLQVRGKLNQWIKSAHSGMQLSTFIEITPDESTALNRLGLFDISAGMYILLIPEDSKHSKLLK